MVSAADLFRFFSAALADDESDKVRSNLGNMISTRQYSFKNAIKIKKMEKLLPIALVVVSDPPVIRSWNVANNWLPEDKGKYSEKFYHHD